MNNNVYKNEYLKIILEQTIANCNIEDLPNPFKNLLQNLKLAMSKAINATSDMLVAINTEVNIWKNKLLEAWKTLGNTLTPQIKVAINEILMDLLTSYTQYMHGYNTGY